MKKATHIRIVLVGTWLLFAYMPCFGVSSYENITSGNFEYLVNTEADSITLVSDDVTCLGGDPVLKVTGQDVSWYADPGKEILLAKGNTYHSGPLDKTTIFYVTQNVNGFESEVKAITIEVVEAFLLDVKTISAGCGKEDGVMIVTAKEGTDRYPTRFKLDDGPLQTSPRFTNLAPGPYKLTVAAAACYGSIDIIVAQQPTPVISKIDSVSPQCGRNDGSIRIAAYGGNGTLTYSLNGVDFSDNSIFTDLKGGIYSVTVRDDSLCAVTKNITMKTSTAPRLNTINLDPTSCGQTNGRIELGAAEGNGKLSYSITGRQTQTSSTFNNLPPGNYHIIVTDEDGCSAGDSVVIDKSEGPVITNIDFQPPACHSSDGRITLSVGGPGYHTFSLDSVSYQIDSSFTQLSAGNYTVTVKDDLGCTIQRNVPLDDTCGKTVFIPSAFTPNGDGINDVWSIYAPSQMLDIEEVTVYNRWGEVIFFGRPGKVSSGAAVWDSKYKGQVLHGVFFYRMLIRLAGREVRVYDGSVTVCY